MGYTILRVFLDSVYSPRLQVNIRCSILSSTNVPNRRPSYFISKWVDSVQRITSRNHQNLRVNSVYIHLFTAVKNHTTEANAIEKQVRKITYGQECIRIPASRNFRKSI